MGSPRNLDVAGDRYRHRAEELKADSFAVSRTHRCEGPRPWSSYPEVPPDDPSCPFGGVPAHGPPPKHVPDVRV